MEQDALGNGPQAYLRTLRGLDILRIAKPEEIVEGVSLASIQEIHFWRAVILKSQELNVVVRKLNPKYFFKLTDVIIRGKTKGAVVTNWLNTQFGKFSHKI